MSALILIYQLKDGVSPADFETWVQTIDHPAMRGLARVRSFDTYRVTGRLIGEGAPGVHYVELFDVPDLAGFASEDMASETVQAVMGQFMGFAEAPDFYIAERL